MQFSLGDYLTIVPSPCAYCKTLPSVTDMRPATGRGHVIDAATSKDIGLRGELSYALG